MRFGLFFSVFCFSQLFAQNRKYLVDEYIEMYRKIAVIEMERTGIPASVTLAQGILESANGNSRLATEGNNHFGIKCHDWKGETIIEDDDSLGECFRKYPDPTLSYKDHSEFLRTRKRYAFLFEYSNTDYENWSKGLKQAGYATNPKYAAKLIDLIQRFQLAKYDSIKSNSIPESALLAELLSKKDIVSTPVTKPIPLETETISNSRITIQPSKQEETTPTPTPKKTVREPFYINNLRVFKRKPSDLRMSDVCAEFGITQKRLVKYNEWEDVNAFSQSQIIYLQPKRKRNKTLNQYVIVEGDDLNLVSQKTGVKISAILKLNEIDNSDIKLDIGDVIALNKKKKFEKEDPESDPMQVVEYIEFESETDEIEEFGNKDSKGTDLKSKQKESLIRDSEDSKWIQDKPKLDPVAEKRVIPQSVKDTPMKIEGVSEMVYLENNQKPVSNSISQSDIEKSRQESRAIIDPPSVSQKSEDNIIVTNPNSSTPKENTTQTSTTKEIQHTVEKGQTLYAIARLYKVSVAQIQKWNALTSTDIKAGMRLKIEQAE